MTNKNIPTKLGTAILVIIAITAGIFVWIYEKNQDELADLNAPILNSVTKVNKEKVSEPTTGKATDNIYKNQKYGFTFELPKDLVVTPESTDNNIGINDEKYGHWLYNVVTTENIQNSSLNKALDQILTDPVYKDKKISVSDFTLDNKPAKMFSFKSIDYGNAGIVFVSEKTITLIYGDISSPVLEKNFEAFLSTFKFN